MRGFFAIALTTFRELIRERVVLGIGGVALGLVIFSLLLGELGIDERSRMITDFSLFAAEVAAVALALVLGATSLVREIERQTCLLVLSRPVSRLQFISAKWAGLSMILFVVVCLLVATTALLLGEARTSFLTVGSSILMKALVVLSWTLLASNMVRPILAFLSGFALYLLGHWLGDLVFFATQAKSETLVTLVKDLRWVIPSFDLYNWKTYFDLTNPPALRDVAGMFMQTIAFIGIGLGLSGFAFGRRDIV